MRTLPPGQMLKCGNGSMAGLHVHINCILPFFFQFSKKKKKDPAGSVKHKINLVWPKFRLDGGGAQYAPLMGVAYKEYSAS